MLVVISPHYLHCDVLQLIKVFIYREWVKSLTSLLVAACYLEESEARLAPFFQLNYYDRLPEWTQTWHQRPLGSLHPPLMRVHFPHIKLFIANPPEIYKKVKLTVSCHNWRKPMADNFQQQTIINVLSLHALIYQRLRLNLECQIFSQ